MAKKAAKKKSACKEKQYSVFDEYRHIFYQACVDYICQDLDDLKYCQTKSMEKETLNEIISSALDVDHCYIRLNAEKGFTQFEGFVKKLSRSFVCAELEGSLGFDPFQQKDLLPNNLCSKKQYSLEDVANILSILDRKIGSQFCSDLKNLRAYSHTQQVVGENNSPEQVSLHPYMIAMTVTGKPALSKDKRLRFRYITFGALQQDQAVENLLKSDFWKMWARRDMDDEKRIIAVHKNIDGLFIMPAVRVFCTVAEELGEKYRQLPRRYAAKPEKSRYFTEGYQAYKHYVSVVDAYKRLLLPKEKTPMSGSGEED